MNRFARIRERKLVQWLLAYLATAWLLLQLISLLAEQFDWPTIIPRTVTLVLGVGILAMLVLAWYHGEQGRQRVTATELLMLTGIFVIGAASIAMVRADGAPGSARSTAGAGTIAVLPFANVSSDADNEYYSDGLTEELISALARVEGVRVAARTSVFAFKDRGGDVREIGRALNVGAVLEGSVRKAGDKIRISAHLIDVADGYSLWSGSYERELTDVFALQDEIARSIVAALPGIAAVQQSNTLVEATTSDPEVYNAYLQGRYYWNNRGVTHANYFQLACDRFSAAVARDSLFAPGWAGLADCYYLSYGGRDGDMARARAAARRALELDPRLSSPHSAIGQTYVAEGAWDRAEREHRAAIALDPDDALAFQRYALMLSWAGRHDEALTMIRRAQALDPVSIVVLRDLASVLLRMGRYDESIRVTDEARQIQSTFPPPATAYVMNGMYEQALAAVAESNDAYDVAVRACAFARSGRGDAALDIARSLDAQAQVQFRQIPAAIAWTCAGDADRAFGWLERAYASHPFTVAHNQINPLFQPLHADPRWPQLMRRLGL